MILYNQDKGSLINKKKGGTIMVHIDNQILEVMVKEKIEGRQEKIELKADKEFMEWFDKEFPSPFKKRA